MTCEERQDLWMLYACDQLDPVERESLRQHLLTGCPTCVAALAEAEAMVEQMLLSVPPTPAPAAALNRLIDVIQEKPAPMRIGRPWLRVAEPAIAAILAIAFTSGAWLYATQDARTFWRSSNLMTVSLTSQTQPAARGQVWWNHDAKEWRVSVANLAPPPAGREYELWLIPDGGKPIRSQTFTIGASGKSTLVVPVPSAIGLTAVAAITDEPIGGSDSPTGKIHLVGAFK